MAYVELPISFYETAIRNQADMTKMIVTNTWREKLYNEDADYDFRRFRVPFKNLRDGIAAIKSLEPEITEDFNFFTGYPTIDLTKFAGTRFSLHDTGEISSINEGYLHEYFIKRLTEELDFVFSKKRKFADVRDKYNDPRTQVDICHGFFSSKFPDYITLKHQAAIPSVTEYVLTKTTIKDIILPFLVELMDAKLHGPKNRLKNQRLACFDDYVDTVEEGFDHLYDELEMLRTTAVNMAEKTGVCTKVEMKSLMSQIYVSVYRSETRLISMLLRMIRAYMCNIRTIHELKRQLSDWKDGLSSKAFTEAYEEEDYGSPKNLSMTNSASLIEVCDELTTLIRNTNGIDMDKYQEYRERYEKENPAYLNDLGRDTLVDRAMYVKTRSDMTKCIERFVIIDEMLQDRNRNYKSDAVIFSDFVEEIGLEPNPEKVFDHLFRGWNAVPNYKVCSVELIWFDLEMFRDTVESLRGQILTLGAMIREMIDFADRFNDYQLDTSAISTWLRTAIDALGRANDELGEKFRIRLYHDANYLPIPNNYSHKDFVKEKEYLPVHPEGEVEILQEIEESAEEEISAIHAHYLDLFRRKLSGEIFTEATDGNGGDQNSGNGTPQNNGGNNQNNSSGGNNGGNNQQNSGNNGNNGDKADKPKVHEGDQTGDNKDGNQNQNQNNDGKNGNNAGGGKKLTARVQATIQTIIDAVTKFFDDGAKKKNLRFLNENKGFLLSRNYSNTSVELLPWRKETDYFTLMKNVINRVRNINDATLSSADEEGIRKYLFDNLKVPITDKGLQDDLVRGLKTAGKELTNITVANSDLASMVPQMIKFCENYYNNFLPGMETLKKYVGDNLKEIEGKTNKNNNDKTEQNVNLLATDLIAAVTATRTTMRDRCNDYMTLLAYLAKGNQKGNDSRGNNSGGGNNGNQGNQNQNNNGGNGNNGNNQGQ